MLALALLAVAATADLPRADAPALVHMDLTATEALRNALASDFDTGQLNMLKSVAHQHAVVAVCTGFAIDKARFEREMGLLYSDKAGKALPLGTVARASLEKKGAFGFGLALGSQLAMAAYDEQAFCANAERERATLGFKHGIWVKQMRG